MVRTLRNLATGLFLLGSASVALGQSSIVEILDATDPAVNLDFPSSLAFAPDGQTFYVTGQASDSVLHIDPSACFFGTPGCFFEIFTAAERGLIPMISPEQVAVDSTGQVYVSASGSLPPLPPDGNVLSRTTLGLVTEIVSPDGVPGDPTKILRDPVGLAVDVNLNAFVAGQGSDNVLKFAPGPPGVVSEIINALGDPDDLGNLLDGARDVVVVPDGPIPDGLVFVSGRHSDNVYRISPTGSILKVVDDDGDGVNPLDSPRAMAVDGDGNLYVAGRSTDNVFRRSPNGIVTQILSFADGLDGPNDIAVDAGGYVFVTGANSHNLLRRAPDGTVTEVLDTTGDGVSSLLAPTGVALSLGHAWVTGGGSQNIFAVTNVSPDACSDGIDNDRDGQVDFGSDPGCDSANDPSERSASLPCDDGVDNDGDLLHDIDMVGAEGDPACRFLTSAKESTQCQDGLDNDGDGRVDFDGGQSIYGACTGIPCVAPQIYPDCGCPLEVSDLGGDGVADPDTLCSAPWRNQEKPSGNGRCGLGFEVALALLPLAALRRRRR